MALITIKQKGEFKDTIKFLNAVSGGKYIENILKKYAEKGLQALKDATPVDTGKSRDSWSYHIEHNSDYIRIEWDNNNIAEPTQVPIVVLIQYGHATKNGGWIEGRDFINPAIQPIFDQIVDDVWKEVTSL